VTSKEEDEAEMKIKQAISEDTTRTEISVED